MPREFDCPAPYCDDWAPIADLSGRLERRDRGTTSDGATRGLFAGPPTVLCSRHGIGIGLAGAIAMTRYIEGMLYGVTPLDSLTYVAVVGLFAAVTSIASYVPARRATRIDPMTALRYE